MKKILLSFVVLTTLAFVGKSQVKLTYEEHALAADKINEMKLIKYAEPGMAGANVTWDFSNVQVLRDFTGTITNSLGSDNSNIFPESNVELNEFGNKFYFKLTDQKLEQFGYASKEGNTIIKYTKPFVKMVYPFAYGDNIVGSFNADYSHTNSTSLIDGSYDVEADAYGKLILPKGIEIDNSLRVKTLKKYTQTFENGNSQYVELTTYRWYTNNVRFPLLVLTSIDITSASGHKSASTQAAYREDVTTEVANVLNQNAKAYVGIFPNMVTDQFNLTYNLTSSGNVNIELYNISGKKVATLVSEEQADGFYNYNFTSEELGLNQGTYIIKSNLNGATSTSRLVQVK